MSNAERGEGIEMKGRQESHVQTSIEKGNIDSQASRRRDSDAVSEDRIKVVTVVSQRQEERSDSSTFFTDGEVTPNFDRSNSQSRRFV